VNWVAVSPSQTFAPGGATGYVLGRDKLLVAPDGSSHVTTDTMTVAILDEIEHPGRGADGQAVSETSPWLSPSPAADPPTSRADHRGP